MIIHDLNNKSMRATFWHAMPRAWEPRPFVQYQSVSVEINGSPRTVGLLDGASCTFEQFLSRWSGIDGVPPEYAAQWYADWWKVGPQSGIRVFLFTNRPTQP